MSRFSLTYSECPHGMPAISVDDETGGIRLTRGKCCGRWDTKKSWPMDAEDLREAARVFKDAAEIVEGW